MSACLMIAATVVRLAGADFELRWEHSVEKSIWRESWHVAGGVLELRQAAVKGSGAGMDPGEGAVLTDGWWVWTPPQLTLDRLVLAASGATAGGWHLCSRDVCQEFGRNAVEPIEITVCPE